MYSPSSLRLRNKLYPAPVTSMMLTHCAQRAPPPPPTRRARDRDRDHGGAAPVPTRPGVIYHISAAEPAEPPTTRAFGGTQTANPAGGLCACRHAPLDDTETAPHTRFEAARSRAQSCPCHHVTRRAHAPIIRPDLDAPCRCAVRHAQGPPRDCVAANAPREPRAREASDAHPWGRGGAREPNQSNEQADDAQSRTTRSSSRGRARE